MQTPARLSEARRVPARAPRNAVRPAPPVRRSPLGPQGGENESNFERRMARCIAAAVAIALVALFCSVAAVGVARVGAPFPGFLLLHNRVVPSVSLPAWGDVSLLYQSRVGAVDRQRVTSAAEVYKAVGAKPAGSKFEYRLRAPGGQLITALVSSRVFSWWDYALIVAAPLMNGLLFVAIGLSVLWLRPGQAATYALFAACATTGVFALSGAGADSSLWLLRVHVVAEALTAPAYIHLSLVFPGDRMMSRRVLRLAMLYLPFCALAGWYAHVLGSPAHYGLAHLVAAWSQGVGALYLFGYLATHLVGKSSVLARRRVGVVALGAAAGLVLPGVLAAASAATAGRVPSNLGMVTAFVLPLSLAYAVVKRDLFEIDRMLLRVISGAIVVVAAVCVYFGVVSLLAWLRPTSGLAWSPVTHVILDLALLFALAPAREWIRNVVARLFFRQPYDARGTLRELGQSLVLAYGLTEAVEVTRRAIERTLGASAVVHLRDTDGHFVVARGSSAEATAVDPAGVMLQRLLVGEVIARYEWEERRERPLPPPWNDRETEMLIPVRRGATLVGLLAVGPKKTARAYNAGDLAFLQAVAGQAAMAFSAANAMRQLEELNASLEQQVKARTIALEQSNKELESSLAHLRETYEQLEKNQAGLQRADRLATLGKLSAGLAHEINTPLAAVMNSLKVVIDLAQEYADSVDDPSVESDDHRQISAELLSNAKSADAWARRAAAFLSRTKTHGRELKSGVSDSFRVAEVVEGVEALLSHRLHATGCRLEYLEEPAGIEIVGDQSRLSQVLVNLIANAIDAYEDAGRSDGLVRISAERRGEKVELRVRDWAGGIDKDVLPRVFDELFTTKSPGRGTGLGLWIARNLVEHGFDGKILVDSAVGRGSCFTAVLPVRRVETKRYEAPASSAA